MNKYSEQQVQEALTKLNFSIETGQRNDALWQIKNNRLQKNFRFNNFQEAFAFMSEMAIYAEEINHHPEWKNIYNRVEIELCTHDLDGISKLDFQFAEKIEASLKDAKTNN